MKRRFSKLHGLIALLFFSSIINGADIPVLVEPRSFLQDSLFSYQLHRCFKNSVKLPGNSLLRYQLFPKKNLATLKADLPNKSLSFFHPALLIKANTVHDSLWSLEIVLHDLKFEQEKKRWIILNEPMNRWCSYFKRIHHDIKDQYKTALALDTIRDLDNHNAAFRIELSVPKIRYHIGEFINLSVKSDQSCYVSIFNIGSSGKIHQLFPNSLQSDHHLKANTPVSIKHIEVQPPAGFEMIKAVASKKPLDLQQLSCLIENKAHFTYYGNDPEQFSRGFQLSVQPITEQDWAAATLMIKVLE